MNIYEIIKAIEEIQDIEDLDCIAKNEITERCEDMLDETTEIGDFKHFLITFPSEIIKEMRPLVYNEILDQYFEGEKDQDIETIKENFDNMVDLLSEIFDNYVIVINDFYNDNIEDEHLDVMRFNKVYNEVKESIDEIKEIQKKWGL